ncbi:DUF2009 domain-containing protein [archaeon]|nr:MAG: DUF2009 domain-containing protein [archaeon]
MHAIQNNIWTIVLYTHHHANNAHMPIFCFLRYLQAYGGLEKAKKDILCDFFTHAFDGSGGDNFFDAGVLFVALQITHQKLYTIHYTLYTIHYTCLTGSCIDGRLTSAWNWCSQLSRKPYYPLFRLTGFLSFDGEFEK